MQVIKNNFVIPENNKLGYEQVRNKPSQPITQPSFNTVLENTIGQEQKIQFSKHAMMRLNARNISLSNEQIQRVEDGVTKAKEKGINDSLVLVDNVALVVNTRNKIVITAMNKDFDSVFTNIDGAVIV